MTHSIPLRAILSVCLLLLIPVLWTARAAQGISSLAAVSAASFERDRAVAPGSIIAVFTSGVLGPGIVLSGADADTSTPQLELPTILGNVTVEIHGRSAGIFAAAGTPSFDQFNLVVPEDLEPGRGPLLIRDLSGRILAAGEIEIADVSPGIFTADSNGQGVPAAQFVRVRTDGSQSFEEVAQFDPQLGRHLPRAVDLGPEGEQVFLVLYLTGLREITSRTHTRILLGGTEFVPDFVGPVPGFVGLDQVNFRIPRALRGRLSLAFTALGFGTSRVLEIEIAAPSVPAPGFVPPTISGMSLSEAQAGEPVEIFGANFHNDSEVVFLDAERRAYNAQIMESSNSRLKVLVPFGAGSGRVVVRTEGGEASQPVTLRTSLSGIIQQAERQPNGSYRRVGIRNMTVRVPTAGGEMRATTNEDGAFLLPGLQPSNAVAFYVDGDANGTLPGINVPYKAPVRAGRDNQFPGYVEVKAVSGQIIPVGVGGRLPETPIRVSSASAGESSTGEFSTAEIFIEPQGSALQSVNGEPLQSVTLTVLDPGRVPANLPIGHFSSTIIQITPTGARIEPGLKLTFPNNDQLPAGAEVSLFQYEVRNDDARIGEFVEIGKARVSADGERIETAEKAITVASYYFVSVRRPTVTLYGSVTEEDDTPARGALVQVRGQSAFCQTDDNGAFILPEVPFLGGVELAIEVSYLRPNGDVDRVERTIGDLRAGELRFVSPAIVLPGEGRRRAPIILAPHNLTVEAGKTTDFQVIVYELRATGPLQSVNVAGAAFASIIELGTGLNNPPGVRQDGDRYLLRLAPGAEAVGDYVLRITATDAEGIETIEEIALGVRSTEGSPLALSQSIVTNEDTPVGVRLSAQNASAFRITNLPQRGRLVGAPPNLTYLPDQHFHGIDRFRFVAGNGAIESAPAEVTIVVRPVNDVPVKEVGETHKTNIGQRLVIVINGSDVDPNQVLRLTAQDLPAGAKIVQQTPTSWTLEWTPAFAQIGVYKVTLRISDDHIPPHFSEREITIVVEAEWALNPSIGGGLVSALTAGEGGIFAGTPNGVFRSIDGGIIWTPANQGLPRDEDGSLLEINRVFAFGRSVFAGTVEGVFRSTDGGNSWSRASNGLTDQRIVGFAVLDGALFVGTLDGVFRSTDQGVSWQPASSGLGSRIVTALVVKGASLFAGSFDGVFRSIDGGENWTRANDGLGDLIVTSFVAREESLFAGTSGGGVFRTLNEGADWAAVNQGLGDLNVSALAVSPPHDGGRLYAGTDAGVFRSSDGGANWTANNSGLTSLEVDALVVADEALFAGTLGGVFRSADGGANWTAVNSGLTNQGVPAITTVGDVILAGASGVIYRSTDQGSSWAPQSAGLSSATVLDLLTDGTTVYAGTTRGILRSTDSGLTWRAINEGLTQLQVLSLAAGGGRVFAGTAGGGVFRLSASGDRWTASSDGLGNNNVSALAVSGATVFAGTLDGVYRSTDGGEHWAEASNGLTERFVLSLLIDGGRLFAGTLGGGVFRSANGGANWTAVNQGLDNLLVFALGSSEGVLLAGTGGGGVFRSLDAGDNWEPLRSGLTNRHVTALSTNGRLILAGTLAGLYTLAEDGLVWSESSRGLSNHFTQTAISAGGPGASPSVFVGTYGSGVFRSDDGGESWAPENTGLPPGADVRALLAHAGGVFAGVRGSGVYFTNDGGENWTPRSAGLTDLDVNALAGEGVNVWAATDGGVFRSTDDGITWNRASAGLPARRVLVVFINRGALFAGTEDGLFRSMDNGANWSEASAGLLARHITALGAAPDGTTLVAGTIQGLHRSTDGGANWVRITNGMSARNISLSFATSNGRLFAGTVFGYYISEDQGLSWRSRNAGLLSPRIGALVVAGDRVLAATRSGGVFATRLE